MSLDKSVDYGDLVVGKLYRFTANSHTFTTNGRGERSGGPHKSIQFFLLSPELQYEFDGSSLGLTIKVLMVNPNPFLLLSGLARYVAVKVLHDESLFFLKLGMVVPGSANFPGSYLSNINLVPWEEEDE